MPPRLRPTPIEHVVDGVRLRAQLSAAALDAIGDEALQRRRALEILKQALFRGRMIAKERLENGGGGVETCRLLAKVADEVVTALFDFTTVHVHRARNPTEGERLALMAVGGYGRGALAPFSDIDLLFVRPYKPTPHVESVIEYMLYALWDLGFKVGHASRTIEECIKLGREDFTIRTALLEARPLAGDARLAEELKRRFRKDIQSSGAAEFVAAKLKERDERHAKIGSSRYLVEPNVKEGKGGLRDLNTLFWIAQYLHPSKAPSEIVRLEEFTGREVKAFVRAFDFLWAVRAHLHFAAGRAEERLSFDLQPEIARRMGYGQRRPDQEDASPAVERFMRRYFLIAREVGSLTRIFCAKLEAEHAKKTPSGLSRLLPVARAGRRRLAPGFHVEAGRLSVDSEAIFAEDPAHLLRLFLLADRENLDVHPAALTAVTRSLDLITPKLRRDPVAAGLFLDLLARGRSTYASLGLMNEAGVLGRYLPEFGRIVAKMQFNMYHSYTVDEHTLRAVGVIADIAAGKHEADHPLSTSIMPLISDQEALFLAMLLHDTGKGGAGGQELAGARSARSACERLGLSRERVDLVSWLVEHHLVMSDFAQKRDISDPRTVAAFARIVESPERLRLLLILTVADIRAVGPGVWNGWKGQLLKDLYGATEAVFRGGRADPATHLVSVQRETADAVRAVFSAAGGPERAAFAASMEDAYFTSFSEEELSAHFALVRRTGAGAAAVAVVRPERNVTEVVVAASDRRGLFADLAAGLSAMGANVLEARVYTSRDGVALDVFHIQAYGGGPFGAESAKVLERLARRLEQAADGHPFTAESRPRNDLARAAAFRVPAIVSVDNEASAHATVLEVSGRDRPGLLEALTRVIADDGLQLLSAHVDGYGERAVDAFYVCDEGGRKLSDPERVAAVKTALRAALEAEDERETPRRLERARASAGR